MVVFLMRTGWTVWLQLAPCCPSLSPSFSCLVGILLCIQRLPRCPHVVKFYYSYWQVTHRTEVQLQIFKLYSLLQPRQTEIWDLKQHFPPWEVLIHLPPCSSKNDIKCSSMTLHQCCVWRTEVMFNPTAPLGGSTEALPEGAEITTGQTCAMCWSCLL